MAVIIDKLVLQHREKDYQWFLGDLHAESGTPPPWQDRFDLFVPGITDRPVLLAMGKDYLNRKYNPPIPPG